MKITLLLLMKFVCLIGMARAINIMEDQCSCSCCIGFNCTPIAKPDFTIPSCAEDDSLCVIYCKRYYPMDCDNAESETFAFCTSDGSELFSSYFLLFLSVLFVSVTKLSSSK